MSGSIVPPSKLTKWRQLRRHAISSYRIFDVCDVELEDARGGARGSAITLACRDWCNVIAITPADLIVLVWQYRFGSDSLSLEVPGGVVDVGEQPLEAARRELLEETGYHATELVPLLVVEPNPAIQNNRCHTFLAYGALPTGRPSLDPQEEIETVLLQADRVADLLEGGQVTHALAIVALEAYWRHRGRVQAARKW
jgi:8-oxo-dGTP pyrophosphatase MutT (NUDIX family)